MGLLRRFAPRNDSKQVNRLRNKCAIVCADKNSSLLGDTSPSRCNIVSRARLRAEWLRASVRVKRVTHARECNNFTDTDFSRFTSHFSLKSATKGIYLTSTIPTSVVCKSFATQKPSCAKNSISTPK